MIEFDNVSIVLKNTKILNNINFVIDKNSVFGIVGNNGAGKSTLLKTLATIIPISQGEIHMAKYEFPKSLKKNVSYLIGDSGLDNNLSGYEYVFLYMAYKGITNTKKILSKEWPFDMEDYKHNKIRTYSQGMIQKTRIIAALYSSDSIILLDEPHNSLDPKSIIELRKHIKKKVQQGATIIVSSHSINEVKEICNRILLLENGEVSQILEKENFSMLESLIVKEDDYAEIT